MTPHDSAQTLAAIEQAMIEGGFRELPYPLTISGMPFQVLRAYAGASGFLDLVIVIDATEASKHQFQRSYWLVQRIANALDHAKSRRPLSVVVVHDSDAARVPVEDFLRLARVLLVTDAVSAQRQLAPILPIILEVGAGAAGDPIVELLAGGVEDGDAEIRTELVEGARLGLDEVRAIFGEWLDGAFANEGGDDGATEA